MTCTKRKLDKFEAQLILYKADFSRNVAKTRTSEKYKHRRQEKRMYFCDLCNAYHVTSMRKNGKA